MTPWAWVALSGLARLVPLPFVDDWLATRALQNALRLDAPPHAPLTRDQLTALTEDRSSMLAGCLRTAVVWPLKKLFKTVLWFLTVKDVLDQWVYAGQVLSAARLAREAGWLDGREREVRDAIEVAFGRTRWSPVTRVLMFYPRPALTAPPEAEPLARVGQGLRRLGGGALMDQLFLERAAAEITSSDRASTTSHGAEG